MHSLLRQSMEAEQYYKPDGSLWSTNGDGYGVGWYDSKDEPGLFKDSRPAWNDKNLHEVCGHTESHLFMAHVRATTTGGVQRSNSHPFKHEKWLFQHNGHVTEFEKVKRDLQMQISEDLFPHVLGTTDSETLFYLALTFGLNENPKAAIERTIKVVEAALEKRGLSGLNASLALSNGQTLYTVRYASGEGEFALSQYYSTAPEKCDGLLEDVSKLPAGSVVVVSEPFEKEGGYAWHITPDSSFLKVENGKVTIEPLELS